MTEFANLPPEYLAAAAAVTESTPVPQEFADVFDDWIAGAAITRRAVTIYGKPNLAAEYETLERDLAMLDDEDQGGELAGGPKSKILARMAELHDEWVASKSVWTVAGVTPTRVEELRLQEPVLVEPLKPTPVAEDADDEARLAYVEAHSAYLVALLAHQLEMAYRIVADAVVKAEFGDGRTKVGITVDQVRALGARLGDRQVRKLANAAQAADAKDVVIPAPFSRRNSSNTPAS